MSLDTFFDSEFAQKNFRLQVRKFWLENFSADMNYTNFIKEHLFINHIANGQLLKMNKMVLS